MIDHQLQESDSLLLLKEENHLTMSMEGHQQPGASP